jgi:hypothetical protein
MHGEPIVHRHDVCVGEQEVAGDRHFGSGLQASGFGTGESGIEGV